MSADFVIGELTPERLVLAAELIASGKLVDFGDYELHLSPGGELVVSILTETSIANVEDLRSDVANRVDKLLASHAPLAPFQRSPRLYELILVATKGSTWLGFWSEHGFQRGRPPVV